MKALTIHQPWASLIGAPPFKDVENRTWAPWASVIGQRIAIHASKTYDKDAANYIRGRADRMAAVGVIHEKTRDDFYNIINDCPMGAIVSSAVIGGFTRIEDVTLRRARWFRGPIGWHMDDVVHLHAPIPICGHQGLWNVPPEIEEKIMEVFTDAQCP